MPLLSELQADALALGIDTETEDGEVKTKATLSDEIAEAKAEAGHQDEEDDILPSAVEETESEADIETGSVFDDEDDDLIFASQEQKKRELEAALAETEKLPPKKRMKAICKLKGFSITHAGEKSVVIKQGSITVSVQLDQTAKETVRTLNLMGIS